MRTNKRKQAKKFFHLIKGKDFSYDEELDKYVRAIDSYLESLGIRTRGPAYIERAVVELHDITVDVFESAREAFIYMVGPALPEHEALEELLNDDRVSYVYNEKDLCVLFWNY